MRGVSTEEESSRMGMYRSGMMDTEMAKATGLTISGIANWRAKHGLLPNKQMKKGKWTGSLKFTQATGVPMGKALTKDQCKRMWHFLQALSWTAKQSEGGKVNVGYFMNLYRHSYNQGNRYKEGSG